MQRKIDSKVFDRKDQSHLAATLDRFKLQKATPLAVK